MHIRADLFNFVVANLNYGETLDELSAKLNACVHACRDTGKQAKLTLELTIKPNGSTGQYELIEKIKTNIPEATRASTLMYGTPEGNLMREDPRQTSLDLRTVDELPKQTLKEVI